jgi:serine/threonine protein kinase
VHRDLKPDNIVVTLEKPIKVALIDFDRSLPRTNTSHHGRRGTAGYEPDNAGWMDGDIMWDLYALACIVVECDMGTDHYFKVKEERAAKGLIKKHIEEKGTCKIVGELATTLVLDFKGFNQPTLDEIANMIRKMKFRAYK